MIRLAYLVSQYPAVSHTFVLREVRALRRRGFDVRVATVNPPDREAADMTAEEREEARDVFVVKKAGVFRLVAAHAGAFLRRPLAYLGALRFALSLGGTDAGWTLWGFFYFVEAVLVADWMRRRGLAHLHVHFATPAATVAMIASRVGAVPWSVTVHGPDEFYDVGANLLAEKIDSADFLCTIGSFARSQLMKLSPHSAWRKFEVTPLGVDPSLFAPRPARVAPDPFEILCVGRLVPAKGQHVLVAAVDRLVREGRRVTLRLVGAGPDLEPLRRDVAERGLSDVVVFEGAVNQDRIRALYAQADAFALASFAEGVPVVLMEAMAMTIPCVATRITGIPELIRDGIDGLLVAPSDDAGLARALARLIDDPALRRGLGQAGRARILETRDLERSIDRLAEVFRRRLAGAPAAEAGGPAAVAAPPLAA